MARRVETVNPDDASNLPTVPPMTSIASDKLWGADDVIDPDQVDKELSTVLSEIGQASEEGIVVIYEIEPGTKKGAWLARYTTDEFAAMGVSGLGQRFGSGEYVIYVYGQNRRLKAKRTVKVSARAMPTQKPDGSPNLAPGLEALAGAMKEGFTQLAALMAQQSKGPTETEILARLKMYKEIFGGQSNNGGAAAFETMRNAIEFVKGLQPRPKGESGFLDAAMSFMEKFAPTITKAIETAAAQQPQPQAAVQLPNPSSSVTIAPVAAPSQPVGDQNLQFFQNAMIKGYMDMFVQSAQDNDDPATYANLILDKVPLPIVDQWLAKNDLVSELAKYDPRVSQPGIREWFTELQNSVIVARKEMEEDEAPGTEDTET